MNRTTRRLEPDLRLETVLALALATSDVPGSVSALALDISGLELARHGRYEATAEILAKALDAVHSCDTMHDQLNGELHNNWGSALSELDDLGAAAAWRSALSTRPFP